ncbi:ABC transporter permease subunit [Lysobacter korlensis]|uniref:ABC transporter permease subunit n=1 Tax=Lysobacter korlensis TaxID=553636 RepID=A0ABV6RST0_9GAMM
MSSATLHAPETRVRFGGVLRSEWIKARSVRPPMWTAAITVGAAALFAATVPLVTTVAPAEGADARSLLIENFGERPILQAMTFAFVLVQALIALIGVLLVSGERGSGLVNVTLAAVPKRTPVLLAKLLLSGIIGFALGVVAAAATVAVAQPALVGIGMGGDLWSATGAQVILGGAVSLGLLSVIATAIGSLFSNTAAAAGAVLSLILLAPGILGLLPVIGGYVSQALPSSAAMLLFQPADAVGWSTVLTGLLILLGWTAVSTGLAAVSWKRSDV